MKIQFTDVRDPGGFPLFETSSAAVPSEGQQVTLPGGRAAIVRRVLWVWEKEGDPDVAVVVE